MVKIFRVRCPLKTYLKLIIPIFQYHLNQRNHKQRNFKLYYMVTKITISGRESHFCSRIRTYLQTPKLLNLSCGSWTTIPHGNIHIQYMAISANIQNSVNIMRLIQGLGKKKWGIFSLEQKMPKLPRRFTCKLWLWTTKFRNKFTRSVESVEVYKP